HGASVGQRCEQRLVEALVPEPADEALHEGVLLRLARRDVMPLDAARLRPLQDCHAGQLRAVVGNAPLRPPTTRDQRIELARYTCSRQRCVRDQRQALAREIVDDRQDAEATAVGEAVGHEVERPTLVGTVRQLQRRPALFARRMEPVTSSEFGNHRRVVSTSALGGPLPRAHTLHWVAFYRGSIASCLQTGSRTRETAAITCLRPKARTKRLTSAPK